LKDNGWPERVLAMQRHWLGQSRGAKIQFPVSDGTERRVPERYIEVFTTRPDTLFGVQYLAVSVSHPLVQARLPHDPKLQAFAAHMSSLPSDSKDGYQLSGVAARNPLSSLAGSAGSVLGTLPIFVAPYVLDSYGSGAVMGVPGHDTRDNAFWKQNRPDDELIYVIQSADHAEVDKASGRTQAAITAPGTLTSRCGDYAGLSSAEASGRLILALEQQGNLAKAAVTWRLRDWLISRQRYWGTPIPMIHCDGCGTVPVPQEDLPVELPKIEGSWSKHKNGNPLESANEWLNVPCPKCGSAAKRDTDTMDTFMDSSWYMFRFTDPHNTQEPFAKAQVDSAMPVDTYVGGIEHAILHLLYARFISKFLASIGLWPGGQADNIRGEPFRKLISQGMVHGKTYSDPRNGRFLKPEEVDLSNLSQPRIVKTGEMPSVSFEKMSKSKYNGVDPTEFIKKYGADVTRAHILFQAPVSDTLEWEEERIVGIQRWFQRIWRIVDQAVESISRGVNAMPESMTTPNLAELNRDEASLVLSVHRTTASVNMALSETHALNTCISDLMQLTNALSTHEPDNVSPVVQYYALNNLLRLLTPFTPAFSAECWERLHDHMEGVQDVFCQEYPKPVAEEQLAPKTQTCAVMENGKLRFAVDVSIPNESLQGRGDEFTHWILDELNNTEKGSKWLGEKEDREWKRIIVVKGGKTVNFVG
jgi:leucyl-tRNA synthetase